MVWGMQYKFSDFDQYVRETIIKILHMLMIHKHLYSQVTYMYFKWFYDIVLTTYEACVPKNFIFSLFLTSQISKCVDDNTKDKIQDDNDNYEEEQQVIHKSGYK
jgi:hypothetical protein